MDQQDCTGDPGVRRCDAAMALRELVRIAGVVGRPQDPLSCFDSSWSVDVSSFLDDVYLQAAHKSVERQTTTISDEEMVSERRGPAWRGPTPAFDPNSHGTTHGCTEAGWRRSRALQVLSRATTPRQRRASKKLCRASSNENAAFRSSPSGTSRSHNPVASRQVRLGADVRDGE